MSARSTAASHRSLQKDTEHRDDKRPPLKAEKAMQAGAREYPAPPFPKQHQAKPGEERKLRPAPLYDAPYYQGSHKLKDKVALITGGDSGIGRAVAVLYAREGAHVAITHLPEEQPDADETKKAVEAAGAKFLAIAGNLTDAAFCDEVVEKTVRHFGKLDVLVSNAAHQNRKKTLEEVTDEEFDATFKTNIYAYFRVSRAALRHMKPGGAIVATSSETGIMGSKELPDYSATKGAINAFTKALAMSLIDRGIRVNAVAPGPVWTPLNPADKSAEKVAQFGADTPMKRPAQPEEIAPAFVFLAAPSCSSYITGEILPIIGGYSGG
jgi:hypothetical protein